MSMEECMYRHTLWLRIGLFVLTLQMAGIGLWALLAPQSFYDSFPGVGHAWVALLPPYNEHLVRDVGSLYLGFSILLGWALVVLERRLVQAVLVAVLVSAVPHFLFHLEHLDQFPLEDKIAQTAVLGLFLVLPFLLLILTRQRGRQVEGKQTSLQPREHEEGVS